VHHLVRLVVTCRDRPAGVGPRIRVAPHRGLARELARELGITVLDEQQFLAMLKSG